MLSLLSFLCHHQTIMMRQASSHFSQLFLLGGLFLLSPSVTAAAAFCYSSHVTTTTTTCSTWSPPLLLSPFCSKRYILPSLLHNQRQHDQQKIFTFLASSISVNALPLQDNDLLLLQQQQQNGDEDDDEALSNTASSSTSSSSSSSSSVDPPRNTNDVKCPNCNLCDGSGRIAGGIGAVLPWIPIKAYRPCPNFVANGGTYQRSGQGLDEIAFGRDSTFKK